MWGGGGGGGASYVGYGESTREHQFFSRPSQSRVIGVPKWGQVSRGLESHTHTHTHTHNPNRWQWRKSSGSMSITLRAPLQPLCCDRAMNRKRQNCTVSDHTHTHKHTHTHTRRNKRLGRKETSVLKIAAFHVSDWLNR